MGLKYKNNASAKLATGVNNSSDFQFTVETGKGDLFPAVSGADYFYVTLEDEAGNVEIWKITSRTAGSDVLSAGSTANRAQDGTTMKAFVVGDIVECRLIAKVIEDALAHLDDTSAAHAASAIGVTPAGNLSSTDVQAALQELDSEKAASAHTHAASAVTVTPAGNIASSSVQAALEELDAEKAPIVHGHAAADITYAGSAGLSAGSVEAALDELDAEKANVGGGNASGTWPISIAGNAASADSAGVAASCSGNAATVTTVTASQVANATAGISAGAVGSYVVANKGSPGVAFGSTAAGSTLEASGVEIDTGSVGLTNNGGVKLSGTWRCMGVSNGGSSHSTSTLWLRIS
jgi:hypothetical protein